uniref:Uncharacterized protein n=1 Tax=Anguilla anguilla TaxID=7936 RepID=A0A0E9WY34_ANGAN
MKKPRYLCDDIKISKNTRLNKSLCIDVVFVYNREQGNRANRCLRRCSQPSYFCQSILMIDILT